LTAEPDGKLPDSFPELLTRPLPVQPYPLRFLKNLGRGREIATVLLNYGFGDLLERLGLTPYLNWGRRLILRKTREVSPELTTARRIRLAIEDLGPTFIKFGQVLSTRPDLIPPEVIDELALLQERVPPFAMSGMREVVEQELECRIDEVFSSFSDEPLAAGSLAQVHGAVSLDGRPLVVKIRRPDVVHFVERDLGLMMELAQLLVRHIPESRVFDPVGLVKYFSRTIRREMNFLREARSMQEFRTLFESDARLYVPLVEKDLYTESVLVMERIEGIRVDDVAALRKCQIDPAQVAVNGAAIFLRQAFEFGVFHGDPHPGNIRVAENGSIVLLDYGMIGFIDDEKCDLLVDLFVAISGGDVDRAIRVLLKLGRVSNTRIDQALLHADVRDFIESYYGVPLDQIRIGKLLNDFIAILAGHGLHCPGDLMLLVRACVTLEGIGRKLDPGFNMAEVLSPIVEKLIRDRYRPKQILDRVYTDFVSVFKSVHDLPMHLGRVLQKVGTDDLKIQLEHRGLEHLINEFDRSSNRLVIGMVTSAMVLSTALLIRTTYAQSVWIATPLFILSGLLGIWLIWGILRSGRL